MTSTKPNKMILTLRFRARIAAGELYAACYGIGRKCLSLIPPESMPGKLKRRLADTLRPVPKKKVRMLYSVLAKLRPDASFIQIGANDGIISDSLREFVLASTWRGILVEPVPYLFERLLKNYPHREGLVFENVAIASQSGIKPFYYVRPSENEKGLPDWHIGLGSFLRDIVAAHAYAIPDIEQRIVTQDVPCITFDQLCAKHQVKRLDVLNIDTEGYDYEIIKTIDFDRLRPLVLVYEQHLLSPEDHKACLQRLNHYGYESIIEGLDSICINMRDLTPDDAPIRDAWRILRDTPGIPA